MLCAMDDEQTRALQADVLERFLRFARIDTQSRRDSNTFPSTPGQWDLLRLLASELRDLGFADASVDRFGYVSATLPSTLPPGQPEAPVVAFLAHVDTSE